MFFICIFKLYADLWPFISLATQVIFFPHWLASPKRLIYIYIYIYIYSSSSRLGSSRAMLASDVGIEMLAILSHEDGIRSVGPLSSEDVAVVVDFHWSTDYMNSTWSSTTVDGKDVRLVTGVSPWTRLDTIFFRTVNHNCLIYQISYNDFFEVYITETVTLSPNGRFDQFNNQ